VSLNLKAITNHHPYTKQRRLNLPETDEDFSILHYYLRNGRSGRLAVFLEAIGKFVKRPV